MKKLFKLFAFLLTIFWGPQTISSQLLYKIEGKNLNTPSYIFGSHHLSSLDIVEKAGLEEYIDSVERVIGELDLSVNPMVIAMGVQSHMMAPADSTLTILLGETEIEKLNEQFQKWSPTPGLTLEMLDGLKPMAISTMIAAGISAETMPGYDPNQQLDTYFFKLGKNKNKELIGLETPEYQGEILFDSTPLTVQAEVLKEMLLNPEITIENSKKLTEAYNKRDLDAMLKLSIETDESPEFMEKILYKRNSEWLEKLPKLVEERSSFIVVGALHLPGERGLLEGLKDREFTIIPIY